MNPLSPELFPTGDVCECVSPSGACENDARVELKVRDWIVEGQSEIVWMCFDCAIQAIETEAFEGSESV